MSGIGAENESELKLSRIGRHGDKSTKKQTQKKKEEEESFFRAFGVSLRSVGIGSLRIRIEEGRLATRKGGLVLSQHFKWRGYVFSQVAKPAVLSSYLIGFCHVSGISFRYDQITDKPSTVTT